MTARTCLSGGSPPLLFGQTDVVEGFVAIHVGHDDVEKHHVKRRVGGNGRFHGLHGFDSGTAGHAIGHTGKLGGQDMPARRVVIDNEDPHGALPSKNNSSVA